MGQEHQLDVSLGFNEMPHTRIKIQVLALLSAPQSESAQMVIQPIDISIGVLLLPNYQLLDAAGPVDYLNSHTKPMLQAINLLHLAEIAPSITWHYISYTNHLSLAHATSGPLQVPTCTYATCPPIDYLLVPGPDPNMNLPEGCEEFLRSRFEGLKGLWLICTGSLVIAQTGLLDGLNVCTNKVVLKLLAQAGKLRKEVKWVGDRRFIKDGKVWSSGGVIAGIDLAAEFARVNFDKEIIELVNDILEYEPHPATPDPFAGIMEGVKI